VLGWGSERVTARAPPSAIAHGTRDAHDQAAVVAVGRGETAPVRDPFLQTASPKWVKLEPSAHTRPARDPSSCTAGHAAAVGAT